MSFVIWDNSSVKTWFHTGPEKSAYDVNGLMGCVVYKLIKRSAPDNVEGAGQALFRRREGHGAVPHIAGKQHQQTGLGFNEMLGRQGWRGGRSRLTEFDPAFPVLHVLRQPDIESR